MNAPRSRINTAGPSITCILLTTALTALNVSDVSGQIQPGRHQTDTVTPITVGDLPYQITLREYDFGAADLPTLHSYAAGHLDGQWVLLAGRSNGLHGFEVQNPEDNFPSEFQNREVWVVDPVSKQSWHRSLEGVTGGLNEFQLNALTPTNNQFMRVGDELYMTGGYGVQSAQMDGTELFGTFDTLSAIHLPGIVDWVKTGSGTAADHIRQIQDPAVKVTGGAMYEIGGRTHLVFGQDFDGEYSPASNGTYTNQVRSFEIVDDGNNLAIANLTSSTPDPNYRRRDLNVFPILSSEGDTGLQEELVVLSGVFTESFGAWTVPVEIDAAGNPSMADPQDEATFKQGFNGYHSAKLGLFSQLSGQMHEVLFGGISLQYLDEDLGTVVSDDRLPFVNDVTSVVIDENGQYSQHHLGYFPELLDPGDNRLRFGANAEFFLADNVATYDNHIIQLDELTGETTLGYIFGGIVANGPHTRNVPDVISAASNTIFEVLFTPNFIPGDYNRDGSVDWDDFAIWKWTFGSTSEMYADGNGNDVVDAGDYTVWRDSLGLSSGSLAGAPVPEPSTVLAVLLLVIAISLAASGRSRRCQR